MLNDKKIGKLPEYYPKGLKEAAYLLDLELRKGKDAKILIYYDPDIDGLFSGLIMERFLTNIGLGTQLKNYRYYINNNRAHGFMLSDKQLEKLQGYTIIAVDFSISKEDFDRILRAGINLINIDHHEIDKESYTLSDRPFVFSRCGDNMGVILNNQYKNEPQEFKFLSGAGMVFYYVLALSKYYGVGYDEDFSALVGITLLSDIRELENEKARYFLKCAFDSESNYLKFLQWVVQSESYSYTRFSPFGIPTICRNFIDFTFSPIINALLRADRSSDAVNILRQNEQVVSKYRNRDYLLKFRDVQKEIIASIMREIEESENIVGSYTKRFSHMTVCCLNSDFKPTVKTYIDKDFEVNITNYIGVACSKIKDEDKTGVIFVIDKDTQMIIRGSVRGGFDGVDYLKIFQNNGVPSAGHHNAFGILPCDISTINFEKINEEIEKAEKEVLLNGNTMRSVLKVNHLDVFARDPRSKMICMYNELSRDNCRIYLKYTGDINSIRMKKISDKFIQYIIDDVTVNSYDASLNISDSYILVGFENGKYVKYTLRPGFKYDFDKSKSEIDKKLYSL